MAADGASGQAPHGKKRAADTTLESEQRLSKRLDLLNLAEHNGARPYAPAPAPPDPIAPVPGKKREKKTRRAPADEDDYMQVEDTPHRVYIRDLSAELSDVESDEEKPIFLPDIEKHIAKIPKHILAGPELKPTKDNQLVLYSVPSSLSLPEEQDRVRKAIIEARARMRDKQASPVRDPPSPQTTNGTTPGLHEPMAPDQDPDAMEIDS